MLISIMTAFLAKITIIFSRICTLLLALVLSIASGSLDTFAKEPTDQATAIKYRKIIMRRKMIKDKIKAKEKAEKEAAEAHERLKSDKKDHSDLPQDSTTDDEGFKSIQDESPSESQD
ncbi:MAG: hypothetical protein ABL927_10275 [Bdellovibrionales bacterium]